MTSMTNLPPPPRDSSEPEINGVRPEYIDTKNSQIQTIRNQPQLIPRPVSTSAPFTPSGFYSVFFARDPTDDGTVLSRARSDGILKSLTGENLSVSNQRAISNIFKPDDLIYPRANGPSGPPPPGNYTLVNNSNIYVNDLSNAGTNY